MAKKSDKRSFIFIVCGRKKRWPRSRALHNTSPLNTTAISLPRRFERGKRGNKKLLSGRSAYVDFYSLSERNSGYSGNSALPLIRVDCSPTSSSPRNGCRHSPGNSFAKHILAASRRKTCTVRFGSALIAVTFCDTRAILLIH